MTVIKKSVDGCPVCDGLVDVAEDAIIYCDEHWVVTGLLDAPGYVVVTARCHRDGIWSLSDAESAGLSTLIRNLAIAAREATQAERIHLVTFGEGALHFHCLLVPRLAGETPVFDFMLPINRAREVADPARAKALVQAIKRHPDVR